MLIATADGYMPDWVATWGQAPQFRFISTAVPIEGTLSRSPGARAKMCRYIDDCLITWGDRSRELAYNLPHSWSPGRRDLDAHLNGTSELGVYDVGIPTTTDPMYKPSILPGVARGNTHRRRRQVPPYRGWAVIGWPI